MKPPPGRGYDGNMTDSDLAADFTLTDQAGDPWTLSAQRGHAALLIFLRGDW